MCLIMDDVISLDAYLWTKEFINDVTSSSQTGQAGTELNKHRTM